MHTRLDATVVHSLDAGLTPTLAPTVDGAGLGALVDLVDRLQRDVVARTEAATLWQARAEMLAAQLQQAQQRILALEAPKEPDPAENTRSEPIDAFRSDVAPEPDEPKRRAWWAFWRG